MLVMQLNYENPRRPFVTFANPYRLYPEQAMNAKIRSLKMMKTVRSRSWIFRHPNFLRVLLSTKLRGCIALEYGGQKLLFTVPNRQWLLNARLFSQDKWEPGVADCLRQVIQEGNTFVDIGAHVGLYTLLASKLVGPQGRVFAFEPDPLASELLSKNLVLNNATNVTVLTMAVSHKKGSASLVTSRWGNGSSSLGVVPLEAGYGEELSVTTTSLDAFCDERAIRPDVVKIDVEGGEAAIFAGGWATLSRSKAVFLEFHPKKLSRDFSVDLDMFWQDIFRLSDKVYRPGYGGRDCWGLNILQTEKFAETVRLVLVTGSSCASEGVVFPSLAVMD